MRWVLVLCLLFSGCNLKPTYTRPEMEIGEAYRFSIENMSEYANIAWWKEFKDPELDRLIEIALEQNQDLQVATGRVLEFYEKYRIAFSALFPELDAVGNLNRLKLSRDINFFPPVPFIPRVNNLYSAFFKLSYEIDLWGKVRNATEAAKAIYLQQVYARRGVIVSLVSSVAAAYVLLKQYRSQLAISKLTYEARKKSWDIAVLRFNAGLVSELEVKQAESEAIEAEVQIKNFEALAAKQEDLISVLIGEAPHSVDQGILLTDLSFPPSLPAGLPSDLIENRPDILEAEERLIAANAQVGVARAAFLPSFALTGAYGQNTTALSSFFDHSANFFSLGLQGFETLFAAGRTFSQVEESKAILFQAVHAYQQTILNALKEVSDALIDHEKAEQKLVLQKERVGSLREYLRLANLRYDNGQNDYLTVLDAEKSLFATQLEQVGTQADLYLSLILLYKALGQGWDVSCVDLEGEKG